MSLSRGDRITHIRAISNFVLPTVTTAEEINLDTYKTSNLERARTIVSLIGGSPGGDARRFNKRLYLRVVESNGNVILVEGRSKLKIPRIGG